MRWLSGRKRHSRKVLYQKWYREFESHPHRIRFLKCMTEEQRIKISSFITSYDLGVIATNSINRKSPEAALVAVTITEKLNIIFGTSADSRKSKNITLNPNIAFVIGGDEMRKTTIQIEGIASLLEDAERKTAEELHCIRHPNSAKYRNDPKQQYFKMTPHWIRYHNSSANPTEEWESELN